jgi:hypothetical protein
MIDFLVGAVEAVLDALTEYLRDVWRRSSRRLRG